MKHTKMSNVQKIVIVECYSSSVNYIHDIRERGYEPVLLERYVAEDEREKERKINDAAYAFNGDERPLVVSAHEEYEETLKEIKELSPVLILPGSDLGQELALRLSADLGLKSNPLSILWKLRDKTDVGSCCTVSDYFFWSVPYHICSRSCRNGFGGYR